MKEEYKAILVKSKALKKQNQKAINRLDKKLKTKLDDAFHEEHELVFQKIDCLECANCCKTTSPIFRDADVRRISAHLKIKEAAFVEKYLQMDTDGDYVLQQSPCFFLQDDNKCSIYDHRPLACREYPHTDRKNMRQILKLTLRNTEVCPAVAQIIENLPVKYNI